MKKIFIITIILLVPMFSAKANPWLVIEGIGLGIQILEAGTEKIKDVTESIKKKKKRKKEKLNLKESDQIIIFSQCRGLEPNYNSNAIFKIDLKNKYIKINENNKLTYFRINNVNNHQLISYEAFSPIKKEQKKLNELNKFLDITQKFDVKAKTLKKTILLEHNAPKKLKKNFTKDIRKGKLAQKTIANCYVSGVNFLIKKKQEQNNQKTESIVNEEGNQIGKWVAMVKHKEKNTFYSSDDKKEINTKEKAINNAISKCWFDPNHKPGDWPSENCIVVYAKNSNSTNEKKDNNFPWNAISNHPKSTNSFIATNLSTKKKAVNLAMKKCYIFVTQKLAKVGYNDCFLSKVYSTNTNQEKILNEKQKEQKKYKEAKAKQEALRKANEKWISANKQNYISQFYTKFIEYKKLIDELDIERKKLKIRIDEHKEFIQVVSKDTKIAFDNLKNNEDLDLIAIKNDIKENQKKYLDNSISRDFNKKLQKINLKDFNNYAHFKNLEKLINMSEKTNKALDFVVKRGFEIGTIKFTSNKIGFIEEFRNIENKKLGTGSNRNLKDVKKINKEINDQKNFINKFIINEIEQLKKLDQEITESNKNKLLYSNIYKQNILYKSLNLVNVFMQQNK